MKILPTISSVYFVCGIKEMHDTFWMCASFINCKNSVNQVYFEGLTKISISKDVSWEK